MMVRDNSVDIRGRPVNLITDDCIMYLRRGNDFFHIYFMVAHWQFNFGTNETYFEDRRYDGPQ